MSETPIVSAVLPSSATDTVKLSAEPAPVLSIIAITKNVDKWIDDCLRSILEDQGWDDNSRSEVELIVVDDHSSDFTRDILAEYAQKDPRIRVIDNPTSGGGNARNAGMAAARGTYLCFVDADDIVPPGAYQAMLKTITATGSDMVVGDFMHFNDRRVWRPPRKWMSDTGAMLRTTLHETPDLIRSRTVWNRMYRTQFLRDAKVQFPNVPRANDIVPMTTALLAAKSIDVIPDYVYLYRHRPGSTSMTARAGQLQGYQSYLKQESICARMIATTRDPELIRAYRYFAARRFGASSLSMYQVYSKRVRSYGSTTKRELGRSRKRLRRRLRYYWKRTGGRITLPIRWRIKRLLGLKNAPVDYEVAKEEFIAETELEGDALHLEDALPIIDDVTEGIPLPTNDTPPDNA